MHEPVMHILLVEDNPGDTRLIRTLLTEVHAQDFDLHDVDSLAEALQYLAVEQIDVILLELSLPDSQGLDTFFHLHDTSPKLPIIVLTGLDDTTIALHAKMISRIGSPKSISSRL